MLPNILLRIIQKEITIKKKEKHNRYSITDSTSFLWGILDILPFDMDALEKQPIYNNLTTIRELSKKLLAIIEDYNSNKLSSEKAKTQLTPIIEAIQQCSNAEVSIHDDLSCCLALIYLEYLRLLSDGYLIDETTGELLTTFGYTNESLALKYLGINPEQNRVDARKYYANLRKEIQRSLETKVVSEPIKTAIEQKLAEQEAITPLEMSLQQLKKELKQAIKRLSCKQWDIKSSIHELQQEMKCLQLLSDSLKDPNIFDSCKSREEIQQKLLGHIETTRQFTQLSPEKQNEIKQTLLSIEKTESPISSGVRVFKNIVRAHSGDLVPHYTQKFQEKTAQRQKPITQELLTKKTELDKIELLLNELNDIKKTLKGVLWNSKKYSELQEKIDFIINDKDPILNYNSRIKSIEDVLENHQTPWLIRKLLGTTTEKPKSYVTFTMWHNNYLASQKAAMQAISNGNALNI